MSEILSKSMHMPGAGTSASAVAKTETNGDDLLFAGLFGGETGNISAGDDNGDVVLLTGAFEVQTTEQDNPENPPQEAMLAMIAALQAAKGFDQKQAGKTSDVVSENSKALNEVENSNALAGTVAHVPLGGHTDPVKIDTANGAIASQLQNIKPIQVNVAFEDGKLSGQANGNMPKIGLGPIQGLRQGPMAQTVTMIPPNSPTKSAGELAVTVQVSPSETFVGPVPALLGDAKVAANIANLRAILAANLEQRNAEINAKLEGDGADDYLGKPVKVITTAASLKQAFMSDSAMVMGDKMLARATAGHEMARPSQAAPALVDSAFGASGQSLSHQTGGQTGGQSGGQSGATSSGGLLNNLNMLQTLDMAKNNWTEMLLHRVQKGLAGGKDQLNFQLNPRNLGKMQISLVIQNDRTNIQIQTETFAAASMLSDSEARLVQMLEASGLRLGALNSGQSQGFGANMSGGHANQQNQAETSGKAITNKAGDDGANSLDTMTERSESLINIQA